jgi:hypothetical protein
VEKENILEVYEAFEVHLMVVQVATGVQLVKVAYLAM